MRRAIATAALLATALAGCGSAGSGARTSTASDASTSAASNPPTGAGSTPVRTSPTYPAAPTSPGSSPAPTGRRWAHVVVVVLENHNATSILANPDAPYLNSLARDGLSFTDMHGETHPSQPNYLALFSGSQQGSTNDDCPLSFDAPNLGSQLRSAGFSFVGYSEGLPSPGWPGCDAYPYARRHVPWADFTNLPASVNQPFSAFPADPAALPDVAFVIPGVVSDMHDGTIAQGDAWMRAHLGGYATWARTHHSLLLVTWDEDEDTAANHIATMAVGDGIAPGTWTARTNHYGLLGAIEDAFGLARLGNARKAPPLPPLG